MSILWKNSAIAKKIGEGNLERVEGRYQWMKEQGDVITCYFYHMFYHLTLILMNYSINYRMCYFKTVGSSLVC